MLSMDPVLSAVQCLNNRGLAFKAIEKKTGVYVSKIVEKFLRTTNVKP